jgi:hypothetical protein
MAIFCCDSRVVGEGVEQRLDGARADLRELGAGLGVVLRERRALGVADLLHEGEGHRAVELDEQRR